MGAGSTAALAPARAYTSNFYVPCCGFSRQAHGRIHCMCLKCEWFYEHPVAHQVTSRLTELEAMSYNECDLMR